MSFSISLICVLFSLADIGLKVEDKCRSISVCTAQDHGGRIVGGEPANIKDVPYQLSVRVAGRNVHFCGASIISAHWAVSAAHCFEGPTQKIVLVAGSSSVSKGGSAHFVLRLIMHPHYEDKPNNNDIAVVQVKKPFPLGKPGVHCINLATHPPPVGALALTSGWGALAEEASNLPDRLQKLLVPIIDHKSCNRAYAGGITDRMICAGYPHGEKDSCQGDSGGPLVYGNKLVGIISFGKGCARPDFPGVYTRVDKFKNWVTKVTGVHKFSAAHPQSYGRIVGGEPADIKDIPYQLSLKDANTNNHLCGATIITEKWAVSAAHCYDRFQTNQLVLVAGASLLNEKGSVYPVVKGINHPSYSWKTLDSDIAVLKVDKPFPLGTPGVSSIPMAATPPPVGAMALTSGWGTTVEGGQNLPNQLQKVVVPVIDNKSCSDKYDIMNITEQMICAGYEEGGKDACQGDAGDPLVLDNVLIGIVSFGFGCARPNVPGVYARVDTLGAWVQKVIATS